MVYEKKARWQRDRNMKKYYFFFIFLLFISFSSLLLYVISHSYLILFNCVGMNLTCLKIRCSIGFDMMMNLLEIIIQIKRHDSWWWILWDNLKKKLNFTETYKCFFLHKHLWFLKVNYISITSIHISYFLYSSRYVCQKKIFYILFSFHFTSLTLSVFVLAFRILNT